MKKHRIIANYGEVMEAILNHDLWELHSFFPYLYGLKQKKPNNSVSFVHCPFHKEETPSFAYHHFTKSWHCYGCGKGGHIIGFFMDIKNIDPFKAIIKLARFFQIPIIWDNKMHFSVKNFSPFNYPGQTKKTELLSNVLLDENFDNLPF